MNKKLIVLIGLMLATSYQGFVILNASAGPGDFTTMWVIDMPRSTYFLGESVTFTVVAFASTDPSILLPDQMAKITIRNGSMAEVYQTWITTNANGSAPVTWETGLTADTGNYTIILDDLAGDKVTEEFMLLYNEETYWQTRVDLLQRDLDSQYGYLNYLFSYNKFLDKKVRWMDKQFKVMWAMSFITVMCAIYVGMHEMAMTKRSTSGIWSLPSKAFELLFRTKPIVELDSEVLEDVRVPAEKRVPVYGHDHFCPICDEAKARPMTEGMLRDHLWAVHDRLHLKTDSIKAKWRARKARGIAKAERKAKEKPKPAFASVEKYREEWTEEQTRRYFQARLDNVKKLLKKKKISKAQARAEIAKIRLDLEKSEKSEVLKQTTSPKHENTRKVRVEKQIPVTQKIPAETVAPKSAIDELFEKLNHEKVN